MNAKETIPISKFKTTCLAVLKRVKHTGRPIVVTRFGEPIAEIVPPSAAPLDEGWLGSLRGTVRFVGDIVAPVAGPGDWESLSR